MLAIVLALAVTLVGSYAVLAKNTNAFKHAQQPSDITQNTEAISDDMSVNINAIDELKLTAEQMSDGYKKDVTGYVAFDTSDSDAKLVGMLLEVQKGDGDWTEIDQQEFDATESAELTDPSDTQGFEFDFDPWKVEAVGTYTLRVTASFEDDTEVDDTVIVTVKEVEEEVTEDSTENDVSEQGDNGNPAAPAIANKILREDLIKNHYGKGKDGGNYIAELNHEIKAQGLNKKDLSEEDIRDILDDLGAFDDSNSEDGGDLDLNRDSITMSQDGQKQLLAYMPEGYTTDDITSISWDSADPAIADIDSEYDDNDDDYVEFDVFSNSIDGDTTIEISITIDGEVYTATLTVTVN